MDKPKIYWDTCVFISWITNFPREAAEIAGMEYIVRGVDNSKIILITSVVTWIETLDGAMREESKNKFTEMLKRPNIIEVEVHRDIARLAHEIRNHYKGKGKITSVADSIHLATAIWAEVNEFHTFDGCGAKKPGLLALNGDEILRGLKISTPRALQPTLGLGFNL